MTSDAPVLLLTHSGDHYTIDLVEAALHRRGAEALRVDTDRFPTSLALSARFHTGQRSFVLALGDAEGNMREIALDRVPAVWARRLWPGALPPDVDPRFAAHCRQQSRTAFFDTLSLLEGARWVNPLLPLLRAESKLLQLTLAQDVGLPLPDTVVTNAPAEARALYERTGKRAVTKLLGALSHTMNASGDFVYTSRLSDEDMAALDGLALCPQIFQALVEKQRELRVIVVGRRCFTGAIDASASVRGQVDWRRTEPGSGVVWTEAALPDDVEAKLLALTAALSLRYAAVDLIVTPEGAHVFLEVNPAGEWGWLERDLGLPIADALAAELLEGAS